MAMRYGGSHTPANSQEQQGEVTYASDDWEEGAVCPECGQRLDEIPDRRKHSILHYGEYDLPNMQHANLVARQRQAFLDERPIPRR